MNSRRGKAARVKLRPLDSSDAHALNPILRDGRATRFLPAWVRRATGRQFVARVSGEQRRGEGVAFAIVPLGSEKAIGQVRLFHWSPADRVAELGFWIRRKHWGRGFGTEAVRLACRYGFRAMSLHRIEAVVLVGNEGSKRALEKVGFRTEGRSRRSHLLTGRWTDAWRLGLLREERLMPSRPGPRRLSRTRVARGT